MAITQGIVTSFKVQILNGIHAFGTAPIRAATTPDVFYLALYTSAASLGTGYTAGGKILTVTAPTSTSTIAFLDFADLTWTTATITAAGAMIYNSSQSNAAVAILSFGTDKTSVAGSFNIVFPAANETDAIIRVS